MKGNETMKLKVIIKVDNNDVRETKFDGNTPFVIINQFINILEENKINYTMVYEHSKGDGKNV